MTPPNHPTGMPQDLILVRHGESEGNVALNAAKRGDTSHMTEAYRQRSAADYRLTDKGRRQAALAGQWVRSWMNERDVEFFDRLHTHQKLSKRACIKLISRLVLDLI